MYFCYCFFKYKLINGFKRGKKRERERERIIPINKNRKKKKREQY